MGEARAALPESVPPDGCVISDSAHREQIRTSRDVDEAVFHAVRSLQNGEAGRNVSGFQRQAKNHGSLAVQRDHALVSHGDSPQFARCGVVAQSMMPVSYTHLLRWEINGTQGDLVLSADIGIVRVADLKLQSGRDGEAFVGELPIPHRYHELAPQVPAGRPRNIGYLYAQFAKDLREGTQLAPDFVEATKRHTLIRCV